MSLIITFSSDGRQFVACFTRTAVTPISILTVVFAGICLQSDIHQHLEVTTIKTYKFFVSAVVIVLVVVVVVVINAILVTMITNYLEVKQKKSTLKKSTGCNEIATKIEVKP